MPPRDVFGQSPHTIFVSKETSRCPLNAEMTRLGGVLRQRGLQEQDNAVLCYDYGRRLLVTATHADLGHLSQEDVVEVVDYNPLKDILMVIGSRDPAPETPLLWMVQKARHDVGVALLLSRPGLLEHLDHSIPRVASPLPAGTLDAAKALLQVLHSGPAVALPPDSLLLVGINAKAVEELCSRYLGGLP